MPASTSASLEPHNGSSHSHSGRSSQRHRSSPNSHRPSHQTHTHSSSIVDEVQDRYPPQLNEQAYNSAHTYSMSSPEQAVPVPPDAHYGESQFNYLSAQFQTYHPAAYDHEIRLEEEQTPTGPTQTQQFSSYPGDQYTQTPGGAAQAYYPTPQTPVQQYPVQQYVSTSPTTARWSSQQLVEERLRLGLSRYATQEEIEAARRTYEQTSYQADHSGSTPH